MRRSMWLGAGAVAALLGGGGAAQAQTVSAADRAFLQDQAQGTAYELAIARLAVQKAARPDVKAYAQTVIRDHDDLNAKLQRLAKRKGVDLTSTVSTRDTAEMTKLQGLSGTAFDQEYERESARINDQDKQQDADELGKTHDPAIHPFVEELQAADQRHYALAQALKRADAG